MDHSESGRAHLTDEQRAERCAWAKKMWGKSARDKGWLEVLECIHSLLDQGCFDAELVVDMFNNPELHPEVLDPLFEEYLNRKLIGDFT